MDPYFGLLVVLIAYFVKGFSGFGPALIMIPFLSLIYDPMTAILVTALLDFLAGIFLTVAIRRELQWRFIFSVFAALAVGAVFGTMLLNVVPVDILKKVIGGAIFIFSVVIFFDKERGKGKPGQTASLLKYPVGFLSGILGGLLSISGPPLVIYMKWYYEKSFFRTQLIGIFLLGSGWRLFLYRMYDITSVISITMIGLFVVVMTGGLFIGNRVHWSVRERTFNRLIALIIIIPALRLLIF